MSGRSWFVAVGGAQEGPYSEDEFRDLIARGHIRPDTYVWADGMQDWKYAGDIPGLLSPGRAPPPMPARGAPVPAGGGLSGGGFSVDFSIWEMLGRALVFVIGVVLIIPAPWVATSFYGWLISRVHVPGRGQLGFTGKPLDIWYVFIGLALTGYLGSVTGTSHLGDIIALPLQGFLSWLLVRWVTSNITADGQPLRLSFEGSPWAYIGWHVLMVVSFITIIGWAWVIVYWMRWNCANIAGTRRAITFTASGVEVLWRTLVFAFGMALLIPIPWVLSWYTRWYVSQFSATERV
ncbi:MAG: hypothetical protein BGN84_11970 [Afipia sp. 62-7]|nr:DUF4339 domain-containing protein [Afipia sp.]OJU15178.1 MAG: hypothetical protein BGN84_11970 [Afipia sp. 62-7]